MYCIMFCLRLSGIEKAPFAPHPRKYWNYVLHCYATLAECQVLTRTLHPHPHKYNNCVLYYVFSYPSWPIDQRPPALSSTTAMYWNYVLY